MENPHQNPQGFDGDFKQGWAGCSPLPLSGVPPLNDPPLFPPLTIHKPIPLSFSKKQQHAFTETKNSPPSPTVQLQNKSLNCGPIIILRSNSAFGSKQLYNNSFQIVPLYLNLLRLDLSRVFSAKFSYVL